VADLLDMSKGSEGLLRERWTTAWKQADTDRREALFSGDLDPGHYY
jgi:hypothetical protein